MQIITVLFDKRLLSIFLSSVLLLGAMPAFTNGGGARGGGGLPSTSAPKFDPVVEYQKGIKQLQAGEYRKAQKAFKRVLKVSKRDSNTHYLMGLALIGQDKIKSARKYLRKAVKYNNDFIAARGKLGAVEAQLGKQKKAQIQRQALQDLLKDCNESCSKAEQIKAAISMVDAALVASDNGKSAHFDSGLFFAPPLAGDNAYLQAVALINGGQYKRALALLDNARKVFGPHPDILTYQGFTHRKLRNFDTAYLYYQAALSISPDHRGAVEYLGEYFVELGQLEAAKKQLRKLEAICEFGCEEAEELRRWIVKA